MILFLWILFILCWAYLTHTLDVRVNLFLSAIAKITVWLIALEFLKLKEIGLPLISEDSNCIPLDPDPCCFCQC